jgi:hypothetical protein
VTNLCTIKYRYSTTGWFPSKKHKNNYASEFRRTGDENGIRLKKCMEYQCRAKLLASSLNLYDN